MQYVQQERERIVSGLAQLGFTVYPSQANYILFKCRRGVDLRGALLREGIMIRDCSNYIGLGAGYYRTAVLSREKNLRLLEVMDGMP